MPRARLLHRCLHRPPHQRSVPPPQPRPAPHARRQPRHRRAPRPPRPCAACRVCPRMALLCHRRCPLPHRPRPPAACRPCGTPRRPELAWQGRHAQGRQHCRQRYLRPENQLPYDQSSHSHCNIDKTQCLGAWQRSETEEHCQGQAACPTCTQALASSAARLRSAVRSAGVVWRARRLVRRVSYIIGRRAAARAACYCSADARALSGQLHGRCFTLLSRVRRHDSRFADPARALEYRSAVLGDLAMCMCLVCAAAPARCARRLRVYPSRCAFRLAMHNLPRVRCKAIGTGQARLCSHFSLPF